jgi:hypothetical protein
MSVKPDFSKLTTQQLRAYVLEHRENDEALQIYLARRRAENPDAYVYQADEDVSEAIANYLNLKHPEKPS